MLAVQQLANANDREMLKSHLRAALHTRRLYAAIGLVFMVVQQEQVFKKTTLQRQMEQMVKPSAL